MPDKPLAYNTNPPGSPPRTALAPVIIASALSVLEISILISILICANDPSHIKITDPYQRLALSLQPHVSNLFVAIGTTWYVVFTYYLFKLNLDIRRDETEPILVPKLVLDKFLSAEQIENYNTIGTPLQPTLEEMGVSLQPPEGENIPRFINVSISNLRSIPAVSITITVDTTIQSKIHGERKDSISLSGSFEGLNILPNKDFRLTIADLSSIPHTHTLEVRISSLQCMTPKSKYPIQMPVGFIDQFDGISKVENQIEQSLFEPINN